MAGAKQVSNPAEIPIAVKVAIPACGTVFLANGDAIIFQAIPENVRIVLGQTDANGNPVYNFDIKQGVTVIPGRASTTDGTNTTADGNGRNG